MSNQFITDYLAAVKDLDEQQAKLDAANAAARRARSRVKDARERVEKLQEYADLFGVDVTGVGSEDDTNSVSPGADEEGSDEEDDTPVSPDEPQPVHDEQRPSWQGF